MPKLTRSRRRRGDLYAAPTAVELNSSSLTAHTLCSLAHRTTPRKISEEDIQSSSQHRSSFRKDEMEEDLALTRLNNESGNRKRNLKRPAPNACLVELDARLNVYDNNNNNNEMFVLGSPMSQRTFTDLRSLGHMGSSSSSEDEADICSSGSASPWGHFVDLLQPGSPTSSDHEHHDRPQSFLPSFIQSTDPPYPTMKRSRRTRITSPAQRTPSLVDGFVLTLPGDDGTADDFAELCAAQQALSGLCMDE